MNQQSFGVSLTQPQRVAIAELLPQLVDRLKLDVKRQVKIEFTVSLMQAIWWSAGEAVPTASSGMKRNSLRRIIAAFRQAIRRCSWNCGYCTFQTPLPIQDHSAEY